MCERLEMIFKLNITEQHVPRPRVCHRSGCPRERIFLGHVLAKVAETSLPSTEDISIEIRDFQTNRCLSEQNRTGRNRTMLDLLVTKAWKHLDTFAPHVYSTTFSCAESPLCRNPLAKLFMKLKKELGEQTRRWLLNQRVCSQVYTRLPFI